MRWSDRGVRRALPMLALGLCLPAALAGCGGGTSTAAAPGTATAAASARATASASAAATAAPQATGGMAACATVERDYTDFLAGKLKATAPGETTFQPLTAALSATFAGDTTLSNFPDKDIDALAAASAAISYLGVLDPQDEAPFDKALAAVAKDCKATLKPLSGTTTGLG